MLTKRIPPILLIIVLLPLPWLSKEPQISYASTHSIGFQGHGHGHGVGMSMAGVKGMTQNGYGYQTILQHYYSSIQWGSRDDNQVIQAKCTVHGSWHTLSVRDYLYRLIEEPDDWPREGLRALMVAARTYLWYKVDTYGNMPGGQAFRHDVAPNTRPNIMAAVNDTGGQILTYGGNPIIAAYSSSAGGYTAAYEHVWPGGSSYPYLQPKESPWDSVIPSTYSWATEIPISSIQSAYPSIGNFVNLDVLSRNGLGDWGGRVIRLRVVGTNGSETVTGNNFASSLGLKSSWFYFKPLKETFNETNSIPEGNLSTRVVFPWYDQRNSGMLASLLVANPGSSPATVTVKREGSEVLTTFSLAGGQTQPLSFPGKYGGVLEVISNQPVLASQRVHYQDSFNEVMGIPQENLSTRVVFPWYDQRNSGMLASLLVANPGSSPATVTVRREGESLGTYGVGPGQTLPLSFPGKYGGVLEITSNTPILASQRVHYKGSFNEVMGVPEGDLSTRVVFPWYDQRNGGMSDWLLVANPGASAAQVTVKREGVSLGTFGVGPGQTLPLIFAGEIGGPLEVISDQPVLASQRVHYQDSFNEMMGIPQENLSNRVVFPWYDQQNLGMMDTLMVANVGTATATITVKREAETLGSFTLAPSQTWTPSFPGKYGGPLEIISDQLILASQRVHYTSW